MMEIRPLQSLDDAIIILRAEILMLTALQGQFVINALSAYGADLAKILQDAQESIQQTSLNPVATENDTLILFEVRNNQDSNDNMLQNDDAYAAYVMHLTIYGEHSEELSAKLKASLLQIDEKAKLNYAGVQISKISNVESINEFKNEVMWQRRDMDIFFAFRRMYTFE